MRIRSLHPSYLDQKGLVAVWRETLLAKNVLEGKTIGYKNHPQLLRFKSQKKPVEYINFYLSTIHEEATKRGYRFDKSKFIIPRKKLQSINVTKGQIQYEFSHLLKKLSIRDTKQLEKIGKIKIISPNPLFIIIDGDIENFEKR